MTSEKPRRRWFRPRYSLATLFVVVTVIGVWLGYSLNWIKQRQAFRARENVGRIVRDESDPGAPGLLWLLGEVGVRSITLSDWSIKDPWDIDEATKEAKRLFPEADVKAYPKVQGGGFY